MKPYKAFFTIDGYEQECLVINESEEKAKEQILNNYFGIEKITVYPITDTMIIEMGDMF